MGSGDSHFNVSFIVVDKFSRRCPQITTFRRRGEPKRNQTSRGPSAYQPNIFFTARPRRLPTGENRNEGAYFIAIPRTRVCRAQA